VGHLATHPLPDLNVRADGLRVLPVVACGELLFRALRKERTCYATEAKPPPVGKAYTHLYAAPACKEILLIKCAEPVILPRRMSLVRLILLAPQNSLIEVAPLQHLIACQGLQRAEDPFEEQLKRQLKRVHMDSATALMFQTMLQNGSYEPADAPRGNPKERGFPSLR